jgi:sec-independent protein translocase protein TatC
MADPNNTPDPELKPEPVSPSPPPLIPPDIPEAITDGSVVDHLNEIRERCLFCLYSFLVVFGLTYWQADFFIRLLLSPIRALRPELKLAALSVTEGFMTTLRVSGYAAFILCLPLFLYQIWRFVEPGLTRREGFWVKVLFFPMMFSFLAGMAFCYLVVLPVSLRFLLESLGSEFAPMFSYAGYVDFTSLFILLMGITFQIPFLIAFLDRTGLFPAERVKSRRKEGIVLCFVLGALVSPPDVFSQFSVALPLILLLEAGIWFSIVLRKLNYVVE